MTRPDALLITPTAEMLEGWCGPVLSITGQEMVYLGPSGDPAYPTASWSPTQHRLIGRAEDLRLDLSRWECRALVKRWLLRVVGLQHYPHGQTEVTHRIPRHGEGLTWHYDSFGEWVLRSWNRNFTRCYSPLRGSEFLADLDPDDDTLLPDSSRLVDALALAIVARWEMERQGEVVS